MLMHIIVFLYRTYSVVTYYITEIYQSVVRFINKKLKGGD